MAQSRIILSRFLRLASTGRPAVVRSRGFSTVSRSKCIASTWVSSQHRVVTGNSWPHPQPKALTPRSYSSDSGMSQAELEETVIGVLKMFDKIDPNKVTLGSHFVNDLGLDSLDVVEIVMAFEDEFGIEIDDDQAEKILTPAEAVELLKTKLDIH